MHPIIPSCPPGPFLGILRETGRPDRTGLETAYRHDLSTVSQFGLLSLPSRRSFRFTRYVCRPASVAMPYLRPPILCRPRCIRF